MRVVSLACSNTEIVCALGCADRLVGVDNHSDRPPEIVQRLPRVGPDLTIDMDAVAALKPDIVLASLTVPGHEKVIAGLEQAGLPYLAPEPTQLHDIYDDIRMVARALGVPERAEAVITTMQAEMPAVNQPEPPSLMVEWWHRPAIVPGQHSWVDDVIRLAGGRNILCEPVKSRPLTDAEVVAFNPDIIVISWCGVAFAKYRPEVVQRKAEWQAVHAVATQHVHCVSEASLGRPSPFIVDGYRALRSIVEDYCAQR